MLDGLKIPLNILNKFEAELQSQEIIVWAGNPKPIIFNLRAIFSLLFSFAIFAWALYSLGENPDNVFEIEWIFLLIFSIGSSIFFPLYFYFLHIKTAYVITNTRAIIITWLWKFNITSFFSDGLDNITRRENFDGTWDFIFLRKIIYSDEGNRVIEEGFTNVRNPREVGEHLLQLSQCDVIHADATLVAVSPIYVSLANVLSET